MTLFEEVKELIDVPTAAERYGIEIRRGNMVLCPFHNERSPSCKLYTSNYHCFSCGEHGDVVQLVQKLFSLSAIDAVKQLNCDFSLGFDVDKPPDKNAVNERKRKIQQKKEQHKQYERMHDILLGYFVLLDKYSVRYAPKSPDDVADKRFIYALHHIEYAWYKLSRLDSSSWSNYTESEKAKMKSEVDSIEREYNRIRKEWGD